jgi:nucleoside-triphosphatase THEP1
MAEREQHGVHGLSTARALAHAETRGLVLSREQRSAFAHVTEGRDLTVVVGYAGAGKSTMLGVAREAWEESGYQVRGLALSGIAAENLESGSGIASRTIASLEHQWAQGRELLSDRDVLVIDEAGMIGSRPMERILGEAERCGAKVVLMAIPEQLRRSRPVRRSGPSPSVTPTSRLGISAASASAGSRMRRGSSPQAGPAKRSMPIRQTAWCASRKPAILLVAN